MRTPSTGVAEADVVEGTTGETRDAAGVVTAVSGAGGSSFGVAGTAGAGEGNPALEKMAWIARSDRPMSTTRHTPPSSSSPTELDTKRNTRRQRRRRTPQHNLFSL